MTGRMIRLTPILLWAAAAAAQEGGRVVAITIDDPPVVSVSAPGDWIGVTTGVLNALRRHRAPAVGFVNESKLYVNDRLDSGRVALLQAWLEAGHELGNPTFAHRSAHTTPLAEYLEGIERGEAVTRELATRAGRPYRYFRHPQLHAGPSLAYRRAVEAYLAQRGYRIAPVTVDNQEWVYARAFIVARQRGDSALVRGIEADYFAHLDRILARLAARGYRFVPLDTVLLDPAYRSPDTYVGPTGPSWLIRWALSRGLTVPPEPREEPYVQDVARAVP